jgi:Histidine kinase-, DNA gyrase B-, and HSP90-like ATPase
MSRNKAGSTTTIREASASIRFSPRILEHLGLAAYNSVQKALAELAANSYDADAKRVDIRLPDAIDQDAFIEIEDDGIGMSHKEIAEKFLFIGWNKREEGQTTDGGRLVIGSKGIGKLAGFGIASRIELMTWKGGFESSVTIDRDRIQDLETLSDYKLSILTTKSAHRHGTKVRLFHLNLELTLPLQDSIRRHLFRVLPAAANFNVWVNGVECSAEDVPGIRHEIAAKIPKVGSVTGFYTIANSRQAHPGLAVRVRGRIVKEPSLYGLDTRAHGFFTAEKVVGEINAEFFDPKSPKGKIQSLINTTRDGFLEDSPVVQRFDEWARDFLRKVIQGVDESENAKRTDALLNKAGIKDRLDKMPEHVRGTAIKVVRSISTKLRNVDEAEAEELIEWVLRYFESNVLRELMKAIVAADSTDVKKLALLVQDWGLKQVSNVVDIIQTQIQIITKLEKLVASNSAIEIDLHKLIESNLWLIKEGLELWSSDKPLKKVLGERLDKLYATRKSIRPDLIALSRNDGNEAVILEFKKPSETIKMSHVTQAMEYEGIIKKHRPNIVFTTYVIGRQYDPSVLAMKNKLGAADVHFWSFDEVLQKSRLRFEKILAILGR